MAEDSDLERTEAATPKRLEEAREKGQVPRSPELTTFAVLLASGGVLYYLGGIFLGRMEVIVSDALIIDRDSVFLTERMASRLFDAAYAALVGFAPLLITVILVALAAPLLLSGWLVSAEALTPNFSRLNPASGLARIFSTRGLIELGKALAKALVIGTVVTMILMRDAQPLVALAAEPPRIALMHLGQILGLSFLLTVGAFALLVVIDVPYQLWSHAKQLRMTKEQVKQEAKESEGDPQMKGRIRQLQREAARKRMMAEVPKADVVITNPTHFAVALRYRESAMRAPTVVAKGSSLLAERIIEIARENSVPVLRTPPLARALHAHAELGREIPSALYTAVAEVLAYVYQLERHRLYGGEEPQLPETVPVPPELDPALGDPEEAP
ncbi:MAG: flagellar type III secretion system protein FlhB [Burkholderiales bacterium]|nr:flagellar type III secretion system protein FlhB [Burkholderiales bacterium]